MRIGVLSDAHGHAAAVQRCLDELRARQVDHVIFLGDAVGYLGPATAALDAVEAAADTCLLGNHEAYVAGLAAYPAEHEPVFRTKVWADELGPARVASLGTRTPFHVVDDGSERLLFVHGSPWDPLHGYVHEDTAREPFESLPFDAVVMGHTHRPFVARQGRVLLANSGSCGLPRDRGDLGSCLVLETNPLRAAVIRFPIDGRTALAADPDVHPSVRRLFARLPVDEASGRVGP